MEYTSGHLRDGAMAVKVRDAIRMIKEDGWEIVRTRGSHRQYKHPVKSGRVTITGHGRDDLNQETWNSILRQAGLREEGNR